MRIDDIEDTIAAVSSPGGRSARAVVRISGPEAFDVGRGLVATAWPHPDDPGGWPARVAGRLRLHDARFPVVVYLFAGPRSYTGQDVVELHVPGSPVLLEMLLESAHGLGARPAGPGEFTARAYLNGKMDLVRAEAVAAVIAAQSDQQLRAAQALLHGRLTGLADGCQAQLADLLALIEAGIDFSEEEIDFITPARTIERIADVRTALEDLRETSVRQEHLDSLPRVMLVGPPNVGKSTLLNRLTGLDRAICSPIAGTTRDVLSAPLSLPHGDCLLLDAAGLGPEKMAGPSCQSAVDDAARNAADRAATESDLICLVLEPPQEEGTSTFAETMNVPSSPDLVVLNKRDKLGPGQDLALARRARERWGCQVLPISALHAEGLDELREAFDVRLFDRGRSMRSDALSLSARHRDAIAQAIDALRRAEQLVRGREVGELPAMEVREAIDQLGALAGEVPTDAVLDRIFSKFCIGK